MVGRIRYIGFNYQKSSPTIGESLMTDENADNRPWVVRTDFSNETAWHDLTRAIAAPQREPGTDLPVSDFADIESIDSERTTFLYAGIGILAGAGAVGILATVLWLVPGGGGEPAQSAIMPVVGPGFVGVTGRF